MLKKIIKAEALFWVFIGLLLLVTSCKKQEKEFAHAIVSTAKPIKAKETISQKHKSYWFSGQAEISSYKLEQARYGEIREGQAVLIYVTEDFLPEKQVKADAKNPENISVLKLNATKNFNTGIYPYSIMQSIFYPFSNNSHALKVSCSVQEWCGHVYSQINNKELFEITSHSYIESEADEHFQLNKTVLENELWVQLRINPQSLPVGELDMIPSLEFTRLRHITIKAYKAIATLNNNTYTINYPDLNRTLSIQFNADFPYDILNWEETFVSGFGNSASLLTTKATKLKTIKSAYWQQNSNANIVLRDTLQLN